MIDIDLFLWTVEDFCSSGWMSFNLVFYVTFLQNAVLLVLNRSIKLQEFERYLYPALYNGFQSFCIAKQRIFYKKKDSRRGQWRVHHQNTFRRVTK
jgi:hypothetical protein